MLSLIVLRDLNFDLEFCEPLYSQKMSSKGILACNEWSHILNHKQINFTISEMRKKRKAEIRVESNKKGIKLSKGI